jgi:(p)ppGpp synthase/HD superfamily hydrolase
MAQLVFNPEWTVDERALVYRASEVARISHVGQVDKNGDPYIDHPSRVAAALVAKGASAQTVAAAWLHDTVEDTDMTIVELAREFPDEVVVIVDAVTHRPNEPRPRYYARVRANVSALQVKDEDIADNTVPWRVAKLESQLRERLAVKYAAARDFLGLTGLS